MGRRDEGAQRLERPEGVCVLRAAPRRVPGGAGAATAAPLRVWFGIAVGALIAGCSAGSSREESCRTSGSAVVTLTAAMTSACAGAAKTRTFNITYASFVGDGGAAVATVDGQSCFALCTADAFGICEGAPITSPGQNGCEVVLRCSGSTPSVDFHARYGQSIANVIVDVNESQSVCSYQSQ
jgi:hypothetical protein